MYNWLELKFISCANESLYYRPGVVEVDDQVGGRSLLVCAERRHSDLFLADRPARTGILFLKRTKNFVTSCGKEAIFTLENTDDLHRSDERVQRGHTEVLRLLVVFKEGVPPLPRAQCDEKSLGSTRSESRQNTGESECSDKEEGRGSEVQGPDEKPLQLAAKRVQQQQLHADGHEAK